MEQIKQFVKDGNLTWTMTTNGYKFYTLNLLNWLKIKVKVPWSLVVICCDKESEGFFRREGWPCIRFDTGTHRVQTGVSAFGSEDFKRWNRVKLDLLLWIAENAATMGIKKSLFLDGDIVIASDPWAFPCAWDKQALWFQCDCSHSEEHTRTVCTAPCTGVIWIDHTQGCNLATLFDVDANKDDWMQALEQDQLFVTKRLKTVQQPYGSLPRSLFGNGVIQKAGSWKQEPWILLHYNYRIGDTKKHAMRSSGHWIIPY